MPTKKKITILIPCLNEEKVIGDVIKDCWIGLNHDRSNQILIIDSGNDESGKIAKDLGADVVKTPKRGLGQAYIDSIPHIKGDYIIVGDADGTYDYKELGSFIDKLEQGYDFVMGTRTKGWIEEGAMPKLHRYFGSPITNWILNFIYSSNFSDIHCGMRGMTKEAFIKMKLKSKTWEYASEMIIKSIQMGFKTTEVPIRFYKDKKGRLSHLKRQGKLAPWFAGWVSLRTMFVHKADFFLRKPGAVLVFIGLLFIIPLTFGPLLKFSLYTMLLAMAITILGLTSFTMGILAEIIYDYSGKKINQWLKVFSYDRSIIISSLLFIIGILLTTPLLNDYIKLGFLLPQIKPIYYPSVTGLLLIISAFINFTFTLIIHALSERIDNNS